MKNQKIEQLSIQEILDILLKEYYIVVEDSKHWGSAVPVQKFEINESRREIKVIVNILGT